MGARRVGLKPEPWRWGRPRVLVEHRDEACGLALAASLRLAGYAVAVCTGPGQSESCPLTGSDGCPTAQDADLLVSCLGFERAEAREVLRGLRARCADVPVVVEVPPGLDATWDELLGGWRVLSAPVTPEAILAASRDALGGSVAVGGHRA